jgi:hypothetical protein
VQLCLFTALRSEARQPEARPRLIIVTRLSCVCLGVTSFDVFISFCLCFLFFIIIFNFFFLCWAGDKLKSTRVKHGKNFQSKT